MTRRISLLLALSIMTVAYAAEAPRKISRTALEDKIRGGWAGQMIGVSYGAPTEFKSNGKINEAQLKWSPEMVSNSINQDDLYVEMTFAEVLDRDGIDAPIERFGEMFRDSKYSLWHANAAARRLLAIGIKPPWSGHPKYNAHANDIDFQIESDFIGLMTPGLPRASNELCDRIGRVMNYGDGLYGGVFFGGMYAAAFFESDPRRVVEAGLACVPAQSGFAKLMRDVLTWSAQNPADWRKTWQLVQDKWDRDDPCPDGALRPFNIDARLNSAYVALGLLYGGRDFAKTLEISTRSGQDSDCNPSSAAGILGVMLGYGAIPDVWKSGIPALADKKFAYTNYSFNDIVRSTVDRALKVVQRAGGKIEGSDILIPAQSPAPAKLEQWDPGPPVKRAETTDPSWQWKGAWATDGSDRISRAAGDEATVAFEGTGVILIGERSQSGGRADVYLDGKKTGEIDSWIPERTNDNDLWHTYGLADGKHTVRVVTRADADSRSKGKAVTIRAAVTYGKKQ